MKDFLGKEINLGDIIAYANNAGYITLALVIDLSNNELLVEKRGFRDATVRRHLPFANNVLVVTNDVLNGKEDKVPAQADVEYVLNARADFLVEASK